MKDPTSKGGTKMKTDFLGFFTKNKKRRDEKTGTNIARRIDDMQFKITSDTVEVSSLEADMIVNIIYDELEKLTMQTGYIIAKRISEEVNPKKICTADVNGGSDGKKWLIRVSHNPHEFIA